MEVREAMTHRLISVHAHSSIIETARKMVRNDISGVVVVNEGFEIKGIVTERDIVKAFIAGKKPGVPVSNIMKKKVITITGDKSLEEAAKIMIKNRIKRLPVCDKTKCLGIITVSDLIKYEDKLLDKLSVLFLLPQKRPQAV